MLCVCVYYALATINKCSLIQLLQALTAICTCVRPCVRVCVSVRVCECASVRVFVCLCMSDYHIAVDF